MTCAIHFQVTNITREDYPNFCSLLLSPTLTKHLKTCNNNIRKHAISRRVHLEVIINQYSAFTDPAYKTIFDSFELLKEHIKDVQEELPWM